MFAPQLIEDCKKTLLDLEQDPNPPEGPVLSLLDQAKSLSEDPEMSPQIEEIRKRNPSGMETLSQFWAPFSQKQAKWFERQLESLESLEMSLPPKERMLEFLDSAAMEVDQSGKD